MTKTLDVAARGFPAQISPEEARKMYAGMSIEQLKALSVEADDSGGYYCVHCGVRLSIQSGARYVKAGLMCEEGFGEGIDKLFASCPPMIT